MADEVVAEAVVGIFADEAESGILVDAVGCGENALGPEGDLAVACEAGELDALVDECGAQAGAAGARFDEQKAEFGGGGVAGMLDEEDVADGLSADFGDPAALAGWVEVGEEVGGDFGDEGFEADIPAILLRVDGGFAMDDPAHVSGAVWAQDEGWGFGAAGEQFFDGFHRSDELRAIGEWEFPEDAFGLAAGEFVEFEECVPTGFGQTQLGRPAVLPGGFAPNEFGGFEADEQTAEIAGIHAEGDGDLLGGGALAVGEFVEDAGFGEREAGMVEALVENTDEAGVKAVELAKCGDVAGELGSFFGPVCHRCNRQPLWLTMSTISCRRFGAIW